MDISTRIYA